MNRRPEESVEAVFAELKGLAVDPDRRIDSNPRVVLSSHLGLEPEELATLHDSSVKKALTRIDALLRHLQLFADQAATDDLTGAIRRGPGIAQLTREIARARRNHKPMSIAFFDVDGLKQVNDKDGHAAGDELLQQVVSAMTHNCRSYDLVFRYGGDEFVCVLVDTNAHDASKRVEAIHTAIDAATEGHTISVGTATLTDEDTAESMLDRADRGMYYDRQQRVITMTGHATQPVRSTEAV
jgi:diguanylate cyclase (GGDEF)-like protein